VDRVVNGVGPVLAIVPARGGSKGIPRKNVRDVAGHPLIAYSIAAGLTAAHVDRVIVTTDDAEIADVARAYGADVPFRRPVDLAGDTTPDLPVFLHALEWLEREEGYRPEIVVHLRPTSPLRRVADIDAAIELLAGHATADAVRGVCEPFQNPYKMWRIDGDGLMRPLLSGEMPEPYNQPHQSLPRVYWQTGYIDVIRRRTLIDLHSMTGRTLVPLVLDQDSWVDIDTPAALDYADFLIRSGQAHTVEPRRVQQREARTS
jgi:CMP-N-acetylneuraminic acid synthetase